VTPRRDNWFETPCPDALSPEFIASLQRALQARNRLAGPITGTFDPPTREAVARLQKQNGLNSSVLSLETARGLGLIAVPRTALE
jgi:peptidoglycan hydrolase-like protein with peptidoglycan-binding domain